MQITAIPRVGRRDESVFLSSEAISRMSGSLALTASLVALWLLTHRYLGLHGDAKLYAFQAMARLDPSLSNDIFLQFGSQDRFTIFSPLYAWCIRSVGLQNAELILTIACKVWFFTAAWWLARALAGYRMAFFATAVLIIVGGRYGAFKLFQYAEDWVTARSLAEALVISAFALFFHNFKIAGSLVAVGALAVHPLMALPGVLVLVCLLVPARVRLLGAVGGVLVSSIIAVAAWTQPAVVHVFPVMDREWLEVVRARSVHLFPQLWTFDDWNLNGKPFLALMLSALATDDARIRQLSEAAMLVGAAGLALAVIAGSMGPAILLQGQAWRWVWVTTFTAILLLFPTTCRLWRDERCGPICALLILCGWIVPAVDGALCMALALGLWWVRNRIPFALGRQLRWGAEALAGSVVTWITRGGLVTSSTALCLSVVACVYAAPATFKNAFAIGQVSRTAEFSDWRKNIPPGSNVFVAPSPASASFAWFVLERPAYLSLDQSAGVAFSRQTALEIRRRAAVVSAVWDTNWRLPWERPPAHKPDGLGRGPRPLTRETLVAICRDPRLNFVVAKESLGFNSIGHAHSGPWLDWQLYDCRTVNLAGPAAANVT